MGDSDLAGPAVPNEALLWIDPVLARRLQRQLPLSRMLRDWKAIQKLVLAARRWDANAAGWPSRSFSWRFASHGGAARHRSRVRPRTRPRTVTA